MYKSSGTAEFKCSQIFGCKNGANKVQKEDIISVLKFDRSGKYIALGDYAGRIIIFSLQCSMKKPQFEYYSEFQSHIREFDALQSMETDEQIKVIEWLFNQGNYLKIITANQNQIKIWKVYQRQNKKVSKSSGNELCRPSLQTTGREVTALPSKQVPNKHKGQINSLATSENQEYMLSSDQTQTYLWSLEDPVHPFIVSQYPKAKHQEITCTKFHPTQDNVFLNGTNMGVLSFRDLRVSCNETPLLFQPNPGNAKNYCSQLLSSVKSVQILKGGKYIAARDFLSVKIWDVCNPTKPVQVIKVQQALKDKICQIFQNQCIYDSFNLAASPEGNTLLTGSYNNCFHLLDSNQGTNCQYQLSFKKSTIVRSINAKSALPAKMDYKRKCLVVDFSPIDNTLAVSSLSSFFVYRREGLEKLLR